MIAAVISASKRFGYDYCIPTHSDNEKTHPSFKYKNVIYKDVELPIYKDNETRFTPIPNQDNICLYGFFQDYNYFMDYFDDVRDALALDWKMNEGVVSIHQRRTDYLKRPDAFPQVSLNYVENAIRYFQERGYNNFRLYSDEISWCKDNITSQRFGTNITYSEGNHPIQDLVEQANCEHQIIANSTFSTWAAYLNRNPNKIVVRPPFFLGERFKHLHKNIYLPEWVILSN